MKTCTKCGLTKPLDMFYRRAASKDGLQAHCKSCAAARQAAYRSANRETIAAKDAAYQAANPEKCAARNAAYHAENREKIAAQKATWQKANPERVVAAWARRRARKLGAAGTFTAEQWQARLSYYGGRCVYCGTTEKITIEHRIPLSRGGSNWPANLAPACGSCNSKKNTKTETEFRTLLEKRS